MSIASDNLRATHRSMILGILTWIIPGVGLVEAPTAAAARFAALPLYRNGQRTAAAQREAARVLYPGFDGMRFWSRVNLYIEAGRFLTWIESTEEGHLPGMPGVSLVKDSPAQVRAAEFAATIRACREDVLAGWSRMAGRLHFDGNRWHRAGLRPTVSYRKAGAVPTWDGEPAEQCERCTEWVEDVDPATGLCDRCDQYDADRYIA